MDGSQRAHLWRASVLLFPGKRPIAYLRRLRFMARARQHQEILAPLLKPVPGSLLQRTIAARPNILGFLVAPYLCADWNTSERISAFTNHIAMLEQFPGLLDFTLDERVNLMDLPHLGPDYHLVLDKPIWFHREGAVVLNIFRGNFRLLSLVFAFERREGTLVALIGAIQGRDVEGVKDEFRQMTKDSFGIRPRDLLIEMFRGLCRLVGAGQILGVADAYRHHRSPFFNKDTNRDFSLDYDEIWRDRGGEPDGRFFRISTERQDRSDADIPARKRSMYRQRYALLDDLQERLAKAIPTAVPIKAGDAE